MIFQNLVSGFQKNLEDLAKKVSAQPAFGCD